MKRLIALISAKGKSPKQLTDEMWDAYQNYQRVEKQTKKKHWSLVVVVILLLALLAYVFTRPLKTSQAELQCPDDYATSDERITAFQRFTDEFYDAYPDATIQDFSQARRRFYIEHGCTRSLEDFDSVYSDNQN